jgi:hypothetical protein
MLSCGMQTSAFFQAPVEKRQAVLAGVKTTSEKRKKQVDNNV